MLFNFNNDLIRKDPRFLQQIAFYRLPLCKKFGILYPSISYIPESSAKGGFLTVAEKDTRELSVQGV